MPKYSVYGVVVGTKYIGEYEANSKEEAIEKAENDAYVSLCHQCSGSEIDEPQIDELRADEIKS